MGGFVCASGLGLAGGFGWGRAGSGAREDCARMLAVRHIWSRGAISGVALMLICGVGLGLAWPGPGGPADGSAPARALTQAGDAPRPAGYARAPARYATALFSPAARPDPADVRACGALPRFPDGTAAQIMAGRLTIAPFKPVVIDPGRDGGIDWAMNPYNDPTWVLDFQTGTWIESLVEAYLAGGQHAARYRARAEAILMGWLASVPLASQNPETLMCSAEAFPGQAWIHDQIPVLLDYYAAHWQGAYNHGLSQDLELLRAGCVYPASQWGGQPLYWRQLARRQMIESFQPNQYGPAVDAQGATNEQATGYANFTFGLWTTAEANLAACHRPPLPAADTARIASMATFLALATQPDGRLVQIGDTYAITPRDRAGTPLEFAATGGAAGRPPGSACRGIRRWLRIRPVRVGNARIAADNVLLFAAIRPWHPDPRARRPHGADLLRARARPDRGQRARRLREQRVPSLLAVAGGREHARPAGCAVRPVRGHLGGGRRYRRERTVLRVHRYRIRRVRPRPQRLRQPGPGLRGGVRPGGGRRRLPAALAPGPGPDGADGGRRRTPSRRHRARNWKSGRSRCRVRSSLRVQRGLPAGRSTRIRAGCPAARTSAPPRPWSR